MSRKYRQPGYQDYDREDRERERERKPDGGGPMRREPSEGPRTPRMTGTKTVARCANCAAVLAALAEPLGNCPKCDSALRCCKMCVHFDPASRFECTKPIEVRISPKDRHTSCEFFAIRTTVEKDTSGTGASTPASLSPTDARKAFEDLFKK